MRSNDGDNFVVACKLAHGIDPFLGVAGRILDIQFQFHAANSAFGIDNIYSRLRANGLTFAG
jgi:hypothetical protein